MHDSTQAPIVQRRRGPLRVLARLLLFPLGMAAYLFILFEEWLWERAKRAMSRLALLPLVARAERLLAQAPPYAAAMAFLIPALLLLPFKLAGLFLISHGHAAMGLLVFLLAKAVGAAALARVWTLTEVSLRRISWLSLTVDWIVAKKNALKAWTLGLWACRMAKRVYQRSRSGARTAWTRVATKLWARALARAKKNTH